MIWKVQGNLNRVIAGCAGLGLIGLASLALTGCEAPSGAPVGAPPGAMKPPVIKPPSPVVAKPPVAPSSPTEPAKAPENAPPGMAPPQPEANISSLQNTKIQKNGFDINLAAQILASGANPFLNRLPRVTAVIPEGSEATEGSPSPDMPLPTDPFGGVGILGVIKGSAKSFALLSVPGGERPTQMVQAGDVVFAESGQIKVTSITRDAVELELLGPSREKKMLTLPDIIGASKSSPEDSATSGPQEILSDAPDRGGPSRTPTVELQEL